MANHCIKLHFLSEWIWIACFIKHFRIVLYVCIEMHTLRNGANVIEKWFSGVFSKWLWIENGNFFFTFSTGKSFSEARNICRTFCVPKLFWMSKQNKNNNLSTQHVLQVFWAYNFHDQWNTIHRELKLDGAIGHFSEPLWRLKTGHFTTYTVLSFEAS